MTGSFFRSWVGPVAVGLLLAIGPAYAEDEDEKEPLPSESELRKALFQYEKIVDRAAAPETYRLVETITQRLEGPLKHLLKTKYQYDTNLTFDLIVTGEGEPNAMIGLCKTDAGNEKALVMVTQGLLKRLYAAEGEKRLAPEKATAILGGILAHELGHTVDKKDKDGFGQRHLNASQAVELRTDSEAVTLLTEAKLPPTGLYEGIKMLDADQPAGERDRAGALVSSHPRNALRLTALRLRHTSDRYDRGYIDSKPIVPAAGVSAEIAALPTNQEVVDLSSPDGILATIKELKTLSKLSPGWGESQGVYPRRAHLYLHLHEQIAKKGDKLTSKEREKVTAFFLGNAVEKMGHADFDNAEVKKLHPQSAAEILQTSAFFNAKPFLDAAKNYYVPRFKKGEPVDTLWSATECVPRAQLIPLFRPQIVEAFAPIVKPKGLSEEVMEAFSQLDAFFERQGLGHEFSGIYHEEVRTKVPERRRQILYWKDVSHGSGSVQPVQASIDSWGESDTRKTKTIRKDVAQFIWDNRGEYVVLDLVRDTERNGYGTSISSTVDWEGIFAVLGMDKARGYRELNRGIRDYCAGPKYEAVLKMFKDNDVWKGEPGEMPWLEPDVVDYLAGDKNPTLAGKPKVRHFARSRVAGSFYRLFPKLYQEEYRKRLKAGIAEHGNKEMTRQEFYALESKHTVPLFAEDYRERDVGEPDTALIKAEVISKSKLPEKTKQHLLYEIFSISDVDRETVRAREWEDRGISETHWDMYPADQGEFQKIISILKRHKATPPPSEFVYLASQHTKLDWNYKQYAEVMFEELAAIAKLPVDKQREVLERFAKHALAPVVKHEGSEYPNGKVHRKMRDRVAELLLKLPAEPASDRRIFDSITTHGNSQTTDTVFRERVAPHVDAAATVGYLEGGKLWAEPYRLELTKKLEAPELAKLPKVGITAETLKPILERIEKRAPSPSLAKDEYLETLAWLPGITGRETVQTIEAGKSTNFRKVSPYGANLASLAEEVLVDLNQAERLEVIEYLLNPQARDLPQLLIDAANRAADAEARSHRIKPGNVHYREMKGAILDRTTRDLQAMALGTTLVEKLPLFEYLLTLGKDPIAANRNFPSGVTRRFLKHVPNSNEEKTIAAFLESVPEEERAATIAYLLSRRDEPTGALKPLLEVFQTVGIKTGQLASIWHIFGPKAADELKSLKDNAKPLTRDKIEEILHETMPEWAGKIRFKKILGSASIKAAVLVEIEGIGEAVMMVRRPHIVDQIRTNLEIAREFLVRMKARGVPLEYDAIHGQLDTVQLQLDEEILFTAEAKKMARAKEVFTRLNQDLKGRLKGWKFAVPGLVHGMPLHDHLMFQDLAPGVKFGSLSQAHKEAAGPAMVLGPLKGFFKYGWLCPDRHEGNYLIDPLRKTISVIDVGQAYEYEAHPQLFTSDNIYKVSQFLRAIEEKNAGEVVKAALAMADHRPSDVAALTRDLQAELKNNALIQDSVVALLNLFAKHNLQLERKYSLGALKGFLVLDKEGYVSHEDFKGMIASEISGALAARPGVAVWDELTSNRSVASKLGCFGDLLKVALPRKK